jgi:Protein of unknown function (DUF2971)
MRVYHLSDATHALNNLARRRLKISRIADLNDPFELLGANLRDKNLRRAFIAMKDTLNNDNGVLCFSKSWANPLLWSHYADKHRGMCLGFELADELATSVRYVAERSKFRDPAITKLPISPSDVQAILLTKFVGWEYEDEIRVFVALDHEVKEDDLYFYEYSSSLALREVILGPRCKERLEHVRELAGSGVYVKKARIAFTKFRVVEDRSARN